MKTAAWILKTLNRLVNMLVCVMLLLAGLYAGYALWDNNQVYVSAGNVQESMMRLKPAMTEGESDMAGPGFEELQAVNPDVCAWLCLDGTAVDYPVLQGRTNLSYLSTDVYGNYSLAGSIFLDSRNRRSGEDVYSVVYGHHMENHRMFGDLELYRGARFFQSAAGGRLILPDRVYRLIPLACFQCPASEELIFDPEYAAKHLDRVLDFAERNAEQLNEAEFAAVRAEENPRILALTTCSTDYTDARTVLLTIIREIADS
ncbi:MAG: class B sortase [Oscillospiraceae bacterium]|nr:class B sortase [Oscillospiraceae bacterium]